MADTISRRTESASTVAYSNYKRWRTRQYQATDDGIRGEPGFAQLEPLLAPRAGSHAVKLSVFTHCGHCVVKFLATGFRTAVLRDYTEASDFRTRSTAASFGSGGMLKPSFRHIFSIGLFSRSTSPTSSLMPVCCAASISRAISSCPTPRPCQSLRTADGMGHRKSSSQLTPRRREM